MDVFGFKNQGSNYDLFRPRYSQTMLHETISLVKGRARYLDIAMGTGQLLFMFAPHFQFNRGTDVSEQMINSAQKPLMEFRQKYPNSNIQIQIKDVMNLQQQKFDLITIGQALHFFPNKEPLLKIKSLLNQNGVLTVFGYIGKSVLSNNPKQNQYFDQFYSKVKPLFTFDRNDLHNHYQNKQRYPFEQVFPHVYRTVTQEKLQMTKEHYLSYLKTMSGYNLYLKKNQDDPLVRLSELCSEQITMVFDYFRITCLQSK